MPFELVHTAAFPFGQLLRRLLAEDWRLDEIPKETARREAYGELEYRRQLRPPARWWLILIPPEVSGMPNGKLSIETDDVDHPLDPFDILCVELPVATVPQPGEKSSRAREREAARVSRAKLKVDLTAWLKTIPNLKADPAIYWADCRKRQEFKKLTRRVLAEALKDARDDLGLVKRRKPRKRRFAKKS